MSISHALPLAEAPATPGLPASSTPAPRRESGSDTRERRRRAADPLASPRSFLAERGEPSVREVFGADAEQQREADALCTLLMDRFRRTRGHESFEMLVRIARPQLERRVRFRLGQLGLRLDVQEVLQDALVNVYRYPDRFDASRAGAFRAWASTIVDNAIRRQLRGSGGGPDIQLRPVEVLANTTDSAGREPSQRAEQSEQCQQLAAAYGVLLNVYLHAYQDLSERERFVLQMVEVRGMRYAELAETLEIRPEALKMVVFRARRRIFDRLTVTFAQAGIAA